jgi:hypothetical protein
MSMLTPGSLRRFVSRSPIALRTRVGLRNALEVHIEDELEPFREQRVPHDIGAFVSVDLVQPHAKPSRWVEEEERLLNDTAARWAADNGVILGKTRIRLYLLETMSGYVHVGPIDPPASAKRYEAVFEVGLPNASTRLVVQGETILARFASEGVQAIDDPYMSRDKHVQLRVEAGRVHVTACPSRNGTFINGTRLTDGEERVVFVGDELKVGRTIMRLEKVS